MKTSAKKNFKYKQLVNFRLPPEMVAWLTVQADRRGKTKTRLLEEAVRAKMLLKEAA